MPIDVFMTTTNRPDLLRAALTSFRENTSRDQFRFTLVRDGAYTVSAHVALDFQDVIDHTIVNTDTLGLGPGINSALAHIDSMKKWDAEQSDFTCYVQDDVLFSPDWLTRLHREFVRFESPCKLGFATGVECVEHPKKMDLPNGMMLKDWIRATCMFARHSFWMSMWPISRVDPETGRERGRPHAGLGSSVDWWFIRNHERSVCKNGMTNLVIPGLLVHAGYKSSTWLKRDLPESEQDKEKIERNSR